MKKGLIIFFILANLIFALEENNIKKYSSGYAAGDVKQYVICRYKGR